MTVLVAGGAGYIGSHTVRALRTAGHDVVVLDDLSTGNAAAVEGVPLVVASIDDEAVVRRTVRDHGVDAVVHFAALKAAGESMAQPERYFRVNVAGSNALLAALHAEGVRRVVFSSSAAVYGEPEHLPVSEDHPLAPENPYAESKLLVERMLHWYDVCHGMRHVSLRYFNAAGAAADGTIGEDFSSTSNLLPVLMKVAVGRAGPLKVFGTDYPTRDGTALRDYVHVDDLADAHVRALAYLEAGNPSAVVNLGTGVGSTVREVLDAARRITGVEIPAEDAARRPGDPSAVYADNRRAFELLGWRPERDLEEIIASAWRWHSRHPDGF